MCKLKPLFIETFFIVHHIFSDKFLGNIFSIFQFNNYILDYLNMKMTYWQLVSNLRNFIENSVLDLRQLSSHRMRMRNNMYIQGDCQKKTKQKHPLYENVVHTIKIQIFFVLTQYLEPQLCTRTFLQQVYYKPRKKLLMSYY